MTSLAQFLGVTGTAATLLAIRNFCPHTNHEMLTQNALRTSTRPPLKDISSFGRSLTQNTMAFPQHTIHLSTLSRSWTDVITTCPSEFPTGSLSFKLLSSESACAAAITLHASNVSRPQRSSTTSTVFPIRTAWTSQFADTHVSTPTSIIFIPAAIFHSALRMGIIYIQYSYNSQYIVHDVVLINVHETSGLRIRLV